MATKKMTSLNNTGEKKVDPKLKIEELADAIVEGKLIVPLETEIIVVRPMNGKTQKSHCVIKKVDEVTVHAWDETFNRWYLFNPVETEKKKIIIKIFK